MSDPDATGSLADHLPSHLVALAVGGLVTDGEANLVLAHEPSRRRLAQSFEKDPPSAQMIADILYNDRSGARRVVEQLHLNTGTSTAAQTQLRWHELTRLSQVDREALGWLARAHTGTFRSFDASGAPTTSPLDCEAEQPRDDPTTRFDVRPGGVPNRTNLTLKTDPDRATTSIIFVYTALPSDKDGLHLEEVTGRIVPRPDQHGHASIAATLNIPPSAISIIRVFSRYGPGKDAS